MNLEDLMFRILQQQNEDLEKMAQQDTYYPRPIVSTHYTVDGRKHYTHVHKGG